MEAIVVSKLSDVPVTDRMLLTKLQKKARPCISGHSNASYEWSGCDSSLFRGLMLAHHILLFSAVMMTFPSQRKLCHWEWTNTFLKPFRPQDIYAALYKSLLHIEPLSQSFLAQEQVHQRIKVLLIRFAFRKPTIRLSWNASFCQRSPAETMTLAVVFISFSPTSCSLAFKMNPLFCTVLSFSGRHF